MKKVSIFLVALLTAVSLFAVVAAASDGGTDADAASATTAAAAAEPTDAADGANDGDDSDDSDDGDGAEREGRGRGAVHGKKGHDRDREADELDRMLGELVSEGVLSEDEVAAVAGWFESEGSGLKERVDGPGGVLAAMVSDGVVSQAQADRILELKPRFEHGEHGGHRHGGRR